MAHSNTDTTPLTYEQRSEALWRLHEALLLHLTTILSKPPAEGLKASLLAVARQFLSDNGITAQNRGRAAVAGGLSQLQKDMKLPFDS